jgi:type II secretory pathway component PulJ
MNRQLLHTRRPQTGFTMFSLLVWVTLICMLVLLGLKVFPAVNEYLTIRRVVQRLADADMSSEAEVRSSFEKSKSIEYAITTITGQDLDIDIQGHKTRISFEYDKEIELVEPVFLLFKFKGATR